MYESKDKMVSHPSHYQSSSGLECIDVIKAATEKLTGIEAVDTAQVIKYIWRWKEKNGKQDLEKAKWYLQDLIEHLESLEKASEAEDLEKTSESIPYYADCREFVWEFESLERAEEVRRQLLFIHRSYGCVLVSDFKDYIGATKSSDELNYGWIDLKEESISIMHNEMDFSWVIKLPKPILIPYDKD